MFNIGFMPRSFLNMPKRLSPDAGKIYFSPFFLIFAY